MLTISPRRNLRWLLAAVVLAVLGLLVASPADAALSGASALLTRAPYLTDLTQTSVQVNWATSTQNTGVVQYGPPGNCTANSVAATVQGAPITIGTVKEYQNSLEVTGLTADTANAAVNASSIFLELSAILMSW